MSSTEAALQAGKLRHFFDTIARRYDFLNSLLSFRLDELWRKWSVELTLRTRTGDSVLDLGTGSGKFLQAFMEAKKWNRLAGLDFSSQMLAAARENLPPSVELISGDFHFLPFKNKSFDLVVSAFTLRSIQQMALFLQGVARILAQNGKAAFLCLTRPKNALWKIFYLPYLKFYLPLLGGLISGNPQAYRFLSDSILTFQEPEKTAAMMREAGFQNVEIQRFSFGMAALIIGEK